MVNYNYQIKNNAIGGTIIMNGDFNNQDNFGNQDNQNQSGANAGNGSNAENYGNVGSGEQSGNSSSASQSAPETGDNGQNSNSYGSSAGGNPYSSNPYSSSSSQDSSYSPYGGNVQYKWNYDDYQKALVDSSKKQEKGKDPNKKKNGLKPFLITICSVFGAAMLGLAVVGVSTLAGFNPFRSASSNSGGSATLNISSQPQTSSAAATSGSELTTTQIASKLTPEVVGVVIYNLQSVEPTAEGSGIVMTQDGYIITNAHVISGAQKIRVVMSNGKTYDNVKTVGQDTKSDLAVLKIDATGLQYASFGDSSQLKVGQSVIAIGNPGGLTLASTVTNGIVSGLNRSIDNSNYFMTYIQTNALINPGNSGGPLVNMYGQVVGINSSKIEETGYEGIGFAIPINTAKPIIDSIIKNGYVTGRVKVGISVYPLSNSQAKIYNYPSGLYVESVDNSSDAYTKGLRAKDIITKINGVSIASDDASTVYNNFYKEESNHKVGETVTLTVYRTDTGNTMDISVKLMEDKGDDSTTTSSEESGNGGSYSYGNGNGSDNGNDNGSGNGNDGSFSQFFNSNN